MLWQHARGVTSSKFTFFFFVRTKTDLFKVGCQCFAHTEGRHSPRYFVYFINLVGYFNSTVQHWREMQFPHFKGEKGEHVMNSPNILYCYWNMKVQNTHSEMKFVNSTRPKSPNGLLVHRLKENYVSKVDEKKKLFSKKAIHYLECDWLMKLCHHNILYLILSFICMSLSVLIAALHTASSNYKLNLLHLNLLIQSSFHFQ